MPGPGPELASGPGLGPALGLATEREPELALGPAPELVFGRVQCPRGRSPGRYTRRRVVACRAELESAFRLVIGRVPGRVLGLVFGSGLGPALGWATEREPELAPVPAFA